MSSTRRLHVLQVVGNAIVGGMETYVQRLVERLPSERFRVTCLSPSDGPLANALRAAGCAVHITPVPEEPIWRSIQYGTLLARHEGVDVVHAHLANAHLLAGLIGKLANVPVLATIHGRDLWVPDIEIHRMVDSHLCVVSRVTYYQALGAGVRADRLHCVTNGVDPTVFKPRPSSNALRNELGFALDAPVVGFIGRLSEEKGPDVFVRVASIALNANPDLRFVLIGEGPMRKKLEDDIARLNLQERVVLAGARAGMHEIIPELDVVLATSWTEGQPLAVMEAMACARPIIVTEIGGVPELVAHGTGMMYTPGDAEGMAGALVRLVANPARQAAMGRAARARIESEFDLNERVAEIADLFTTLCADGARIEKRVSALPSVKVAAAKSISGESARDAR